MPTTNIRTEHIGSMLRPAAVLDARHRRAEGLIDGEELRAIEDQAILAALAAQESIGIGVIGDGEFRRTDFRSGFAAAVSGLQEEVFERTWHLDGRETKTQSRRWQVVGPIERRGPIAAGEARFLAGHAHAPFKVTLPSSGYMAERLFRPGPGNPYESVEELGEAIREVLLGEVAQLADLGVPYVQFDNPGYATFLDAEARARLESEGRDAEAAFAAMLQADQRLIDALPRRSQMTVGLHVCRGNNSGSWLHQGDYGPIAEQLFAVLPVDRFLLEFDDERSGNFECLRFVPAGKVAVLGLVSTKVAEVESPEYLVRRLDDAASFIDADQLAISPQCGFATHADGANPLSAEQQYGKLAVLVEAAELWFNA